MVVIEKEKLGRKLCVWLDFFQTKKKIFNETIHPRFFYNTGSGYSFITLSFMEILVKFQGHSEMEDAAKDSFRLRNFMFHFAFSQPLHRIRPRIRISRFIRRILERDRCVIQYFLLARFGLFGLGCLRQVVYIY